MRAIGKGLIMPRRLRNPRRSYDLEGREVEPATVANVRKCGARGITVKRACNHEALLPFKCLRADEYVAAVALRCRCTACGGRRIECYPDWIGGWRLRGDSLAAAHQRKSADA